MVDFKITPGYSLAFVIITTIVLCILVFILTKDAIPGTWMAPDSFVSKMGFIVDAKSPSRIRIGATFADRAMIVMIYTHANVILQRYDFRRNGDQVNISYDKTVTETGQKIGQLFEDGDYQINIDGKSLIIYDKLRVILHLRQID